MLFDQTKERKKMLRIHHLNLFHIHRSLRLILRYKAVEVATPIATPLQCGRAKRPGLLFLKLIALALLTVSIASETSI